MINLEFLKFSVERLQHSGNGRPLPPEWGGFGEGAGEHAGYQSSLQHKESVSLFEYSILQRKVKAGERVPSRPDAEGDHDWVERPLLGESTRHSPGLEALGRRSLRGLGLFAKGPSDEGVNILRV